MVKEGEGKRRREWKRKGEEEVIENEREWLRKRKGREREKGVERGG